MVDFEEELEEDVLPRTLLVASIKVGLVSWISGPFIVNNNTTTSDIIEKKKRERERRHEFHR
jgi:hypothetical protein